MNKRPPPDELIEIYSAILAAPTRLTTGPGNVGGTSIVDAGLIGAGANSFFSMLIIIHPGELLLVDSSDITAFNNATGEITFDTAYKGGQVPAGTPYKIVPFRFVPAEVAALTALVTALMADVGDASTAALGSIFGILGDPAIGEDLATRIGYEGALSLADKLTVARALLLDEITALRMAELDPAGIPADVAAVAAQLVAVLVDTAALLGDTAAILVDTTAIEAAIGAIEGATTLHNKLTVARAGYLAYLSRIANTTIDLQQVAGTYDLFTCATQDVQIEGLVIRLPNVNVSDDVNITGISIQTDDATPCVFISQAQGLKANLTAEVQLSWYGKALLKVGKKIRLTIYGGAADASTVCDVIAEYRAKVEGGTL